MTRYQLMLIAIAALFVMLLFSHVHTNDIKNAKDKAGDRLVQKVEAYNKKHKNTSMFGLGANGNNANGYNSGQFNNDNGSYSNPAPFGRPPAQGAPAQTNPNNDYYPPPPQSPQSSNTPAGPPLFKNPHAVYLDNGKQLAFSGSQVYTYDANGKRVPLPDGVYSLFEGRYSMLVKGGLKVIN